MADQTVVLKSGRVTGRIKPGTIGEVIIPIRGGSEAFLAQAENPNDVLEVGVPIIVTAYYPPRTVIVTRNSLQREER